MPRAVALLRGINVSGRNKVPMAELRAACREAGLGEVETYIASGNILFDAPDDVAAIEAVVEGIIQDRFGLAIPVVVRTAAEWSEHARGSPFPGAEKAEPDRLMLCLPKRPLADGAAEALGARATAGERIVADRGALWIYYPEGAGTSRLSPAMFDKAAGSPVTARNWRTVMKLQEMLAG